MTLHDRLREIREMHAGRFEDSGTSKIPRLLDVIEVLVEGLSFYSNREHWEHSDAYSENTTVCGDDHYCYKGSYFYGGKIANKQLTKAADILNPRSAE